MKQYQGEKAIISLTSWKARIKTVGLTIYSLLTQCPGFHIVLVLSEEEFPRKEEELPLDLLLLSIANRIEILWVYKNYKAFKKVLFSMDKYREVPVISADDDCIYLYNYADAFYREWRRHRNCFITCYLQTWHFMNAPHLGGAATLYPPYVFGDFAIKCLNDTEIYNYTKQDDDFYTAMREVLGLRLAIKIADYHKLYFFHDETEPSHNEIRRLNTSRHDLTKTILNVVRAYYNGTF